jgi:uncharacterized protein
MLRKLLLLLIALAPLFHAGARVYKVGDVPMVHLQDRTRYVSNPDNILSSSSVATMDSLLFSLEEKTGIQVVVAVLTDIEGGDCFDFAYRLGKDNGVGQQGRDNGLVILLSTGERCVQFATGYGLEGVMPDAICKRIQQRHMVGHFSVDDWDTGMVEGIRAVCGHLDGSMVNDGGDEEDEGLVALAVFATLILGGGLVIFLMVWYNSRCPKCGKHEIKRVNSRIVKRCNGYVVRENTYTCSSCGHTFSRREHADDLSNRGGRVVIGGIGGRGFGGGGGFRGGSFGGGSFGGGGAGSRF